MSAVHLGPTGSAGPLRTGLRTGPPVPCCVPRPQALGGTPGALGFSPPPKERAPCSPSLGPSWGSPEQTGSRLQSPLAARRGEGGGLEHLAGGSTLLSRDCSVLWRTLRPGSTPVSQRPPQRAEPVRVDGGLGEEPPAKGGKPLDSQPWVAAGRGCLSVSSLPARDGLVPWPPPSSNPSQPPPRRQGVNRDTSAILLEFGRVGDVPSVGRAASTHGRPFCEDVNQHNTPHGQARSPREPGKKNIRMSSGFLFEKELFS